MLVDFKRGIQEGFRKDDMRSPLDSVKGENTVMSVVSSGVTRVLMHAPSGRRPGG